MLPHCSKHRLDLRSYFSPNDCHRLRQGCTFAAWHRGTRGKTIVGLGAGSFEHNSAGNAPGPVKGFTDFLTCERHDDIIVRPVHTSDYQLPEICLWSGNKRHNGEPGLLPLF